MKHLLTQISSVRYDELVEQWLNGSLKQKWDELQGKKLTKRQQVEERQIRAIATIVQLPDGDSVKNIVQKGRWSKLNIYRVDGTKGLILEVLK